jgi:hypothetical protein
MNVGGVDVLHTFATSNANFVTKVKWMMLRPSQLQKLKTSKRPGARDLLHSTILQVAGMFGKHRNSRLDNHIKGGTTWIENGTEREELRRKEMEELQTLQHGVDIESAEDDQVIKLILKYLTKIWTGQDNDSSDYAYA